jgi:hypothetical protein
MCYNIGVELPLSVRKLLHDFDMPADPFGEVWERAIIGRVMERGTWVDMRWLLASFGRERLAGFLAERGHKTLAPRELRFWSTVCHAPECQADRWVAAAIAGQRAWRG